MDTLQRQQYNAKFHESAYNAFIEDIQESTGRALEFRLCETPLFLTKALSDKLVEASDSILSQVTSEPLFSECKKAIPPHAAVPNCDDHPQFVQIDFAICQNDQGEFIPQLIEMQGFPTVYAFQHFLDLKTRKHLPIPETYTTYYSGLDSDKFVRQFREVLIAQASAENTILLEIFPHRQKTRIDFFCTERLLGVKPVCLTEVKKEGRRLFYEENGKQIPIHRIYNRVIFDELHRVEGLTYAFDFRDDLEVQWCNHPDWFFRISKYCLPLIHSPYAPKAYFLSELSSLPLDLENYVLKPLFSFSGGGVEVDVTKEMIEQIRDKANYILQRKVEYAPLILCPDGTYTKAEVRMMYLWKDKPTLVNNLARMSKGKLMGASFNKTQMWTGSGISYHPL